MSCDSRRRLSSGRTSSTRSSPRCRACSTRLGSARHDPPQRSVDRSPCVSATHVLVVEDDPSVRGLLHTLLSAEGYEVSTASDGLAGLVKATASKPALVLLDLMMPDLGGVR